MNTNNTFKQAAIVALLASFGLLSSCSDKPNPSVEEVAPADTSVSVDVEEAELAFWQSIDKHLQNILDLTLRLESDIDTFLQSTNQSNLEQAQLSLGKALLSFNELSALTLLQQNAPEVFPDSNTFLFRVQAHPIQPGFLDRFGPYKYSGLVYDIGFGLSAASLVNQHGLTDHSEVVLGIYAIEFMLLGEAGNRSASDYVEVTKLGKEELDQQLSHTGEVPSNRRRILLDLQIKQLNKDLKELRAYLAQAQSADIARWRALSPQQQISKIRAALRSGVTQSQLELAAILSQLSDSDDENSVTDAQALPPEGQTPAQQASSLALRISSIKEMTDYLSGVEQEAVDQALDKAIAILESLDTEDTAKSLAQAQEVYELLKIAL